MAKADSLAELQVIADNVPAAIALVAQLGTDLKYRFVNRRYAELYGRTPADVVGRHLREVLGETAFAQASLNMHKALSGQHVGFDLELPSAAGEARVVHVIYAPDRDSSRKVIGFIGVISDITERKQLEQAVQRLQRELAELKETFTQRARDPRGGA